MFVQIQPTENPARLKFLLVRKVLSSGTADFPDKASSARSPLARRLFAIEGVTGVYLDRDSITLAKSDDKDWQALKPTILAAIMDHFTGGHPVILEDSEKAAADELVEDADAVPEVEGVADYRDAMPKPGLDTEEGKAIRHLLDERINPQVAAHGGHIALVDVQDDTVYIRLEGGCQGCGMADVTLKQGVATEIKSLVPMINRVLDVTDHAGGTNPYYQPGKGGASAI